MCKNVPIVVSFAGTDPSVALGFKQISKRFLPLEVMPRR